MYTYILNQIKRSAVSNAAFCLLLALAGALLALGAGLLLSALGNAREIDGQFTTIALPDAVAIHRFAVNQVVEQDLQEFEMYGQTISRDDLLWGGAFFEQRVAFYMQERTLANIQNVVYRPGAVDMDPRRYFGAFSPDIIALHDARGGWFASGSAGGSAAFVARVTDITESYMIQVRADPDTGEQRFVINVYAYVYFEIEQTLLLHPDIAAPTRLFIQMSSQDVLGGYFFTEGERYFISGEYTANAGKFDVNTGQFTSMPTLRSPGFFDFGGQGAEDTVIKTYASIDGFEAAEWANLTRHIWGTTPTEHDFPMDVIARRASGYVTNPHFVLGDMTFEEALHSETGDAIAYTLRAAEMDAHRLNILTTGNLYSKFPFNQHRANITEGRSFTREEYESGARLAIVPRALAQRNGLTVGDVITLTFFEGRFMSIQTFVTDGPRQRSHRLWNPGGFTQGMHTAEPMDFEIIGIYTAPAPREDDPHSIPFNTIFIPDNAFAGFYEPDGEPFPWLDDRAESPLLNVIVVPNGRNEEFSQTINALIPGYGAFFRLYDQGYSVVRNALDNLLRNGWFIFVLCLAGWLIAVVVFCLFFILRKRKEAGLLYALGISGKSRFRWIFAQCLIVIVIAQGIAFGAATVSFGRIFNYAVETAIAAAPDEPTLFGDAAVVADGVQRTMEFELNPLAIPLATTVSVVLLLLATCGIARVITKSNPRTLRGVEG